VSENYDSAPETKKHIERVRRLIIGAINLLKVRVECHDQSKLGDVEKKIFDIYTPKLKATTYGSDQYKEFLAEMSVALKHHYENNSHHPEHFENGIDGMTLIDLLEMVCDWKAATERHADGSIAASLIINKERFKISDQVSNILENTCKQMNWL
jgi:hypothetical protein